MRIIRKFLRMILPTPKRVLTWSVKDFNIAKSYLKRLDNPENPENSMWDKLNNPWNDSVHILHETNEIIRKNEKRII